MHRVACLRGVPGSTRASWLFLAGLLLGGSGCTGPSARITIPTVSPQDAGRAAIAEYDKNKDGTLDTAELERCPSLLHGLKYLDKDGNHKVSADEIADRLTAFQDSNVGILGIACRVKRDGKALVGATVTLRPEKFMGDGIAPASGLSDDQGNVILQMEGMDVPGVRWGYYRIEVSKKDNAGKELLPARYNSATTLGKEVAPDRKEAIVLDLVTRS